MQTLQLKNVNKTFGNLKVLEDISLNVKKGEFAAIVGPSGCGKSTALRMFAGLETPSEGEVLANGKLVTEPDSNRVMIFQEHALYPWRTIEDNVRLGLELTNSPKNERRERVNRVLEKVGLDGFQTYYPHQLSGGMKQRASIARALVMDPEVLLLDEPYGALDAITRLTMQNELIKLWHGSNQTMLLITHDIDEALYLADRVFVMSSRPGKVVSEVQNEIPRPRDRNSVDFVKLRQEIMKSLDIN
ncbi:ABC transporter ATP-binding protein [Pseudalkalibacillus decolorationis]|uniref:ABC transporter ATP-binding protein n=1 Tax=Pseudalkalibacillus decolorationis TaxID=163879 RepID=UPI0021477AC2|nr:ABC transporter ATP-binding protein [Pseudalkalibacillus decolorationis]